MKREHKLRLVVNTDDQRGSREPITFEDEPPPSASEIAEAEALRESIDRGDSALFEALRAVHNPSSIDDEAHEAILRRAMGEASSAEQIDLPATPSERAGADRLRAAMSHARGLSSETPDEPFVELAEALVAAHRPRDIEPLRNEAMIARALGRASAKRRAGRVLPIVSAAIVGVAAMAAGIALYFGSSGDNVVASSVATPSLQRSRSAAGLFDPSTPFPRVGGESARVDRIASARATDLRENRFAMWGVR